MSLLASWEPQLAQPTRQPCAVPLGHRGLKADPKDGVQFASSQAPLRTQTYISNHIYNMYVPPLGFLLASAHLLGFEFGVHTDHMVSSITNMELRLDADWMLCPRMFVKVALQRMQRAKNDIQTVNMLRKKLAKEEPIIRFNSQLVLNNAHLEIHCASAELYNNQAPISDSVGKYHHVMSRRVHGRTTVRSRGSFFRITC